MNIIVFSESNDNMEKTIAFLSAILVLFSLPTYEAKKLTKRGTVTQCNANDITNVKHCCSLPELLHDDIGTYCWSTLQSMKFLQEETNNCFLECMLKTVAILTPKGAINATKARTNLVTPLMPAPWRTVIYDAIITCASEVEDKIPTWTKVEQSCDPRPSLFMTCIGHYEGVNCPSQFVKSPPAGTDCSVLTKNLKECSVFANLETLKEEE